MPVGSDPLTFMMTAMLLFVVIILGVFFLLRFRWWLTRRGFRPSYISLGNAFQQIQATAIPQVEYSLQEQEKENIDEDDEGGPDDPTKYYRRRMNHTDQKRPRPNTLGMKPTDFQVRAIVAGYRPPAAAASCSAARRIPRSDRRNKSARFRVSGTTSASVLSAMRSFGSLKTGTSTAPFAI